MENVGTKVRLGTDLDAWNKLFVQLCASYGACLITCADYHSSEVIGTSQASGRIIGWSVGTDGVGGAAKVRVIYEKGIGEHFTITFVADSVTVDSVDYHGNAPAIPVIAFTRESVSKFPLYD